MRIDGGSGSLRLGEEAFYASYKTAEARVSAEITLAFATTVQKTQGSQYEVVILPIYLKHSLMLSRNLLYTELTRARKLALLVRPQQAISFALKQVKDQQRHTLLAHRLTRVPLR